MLEILLLVIFVFIMLFGLVIIIGAPYLPTLKPQAETALDMLDLKPGQKLLELGSGDGRVLALAADRGIKSVGIELNPLLVVYTKLRYWKQRDLIEVRWGNFWTQDFSGYDGIYTFLHTRFMRKLDNKIAQEITQSVKLVSYAFEIPGKKPIKTDNAQYLYNYAPIASRPHSK